MRIFRNAKKDIKFFFQLPLRKDEVHGTPLIINNDEFL